MNLYVIILHLYPSIHLLFSIPRRASPHRSTPLSTTSLVPPPPPLHRSTPHPPLRSSAAWAASPLSARRMQRPSEAFSTEAWSLESSVVFTTQRGAGRGHGVDRPCGRMRFEGEQWGEFEGVRGRGSRGKRRNQRYLQNPTNGRMGRREEVGCAFFFGFGGDGIGRWFRNALDNI